MSKLSQTIRKTVRQGNSFPAIVLDAYGDKATVQLSRNGAVYKGLDVIGNQVAIGQSVEVSFASGSPIILASPPVVLPPSISERTRPLAPIAHMNAPPVTATSGSGIGGSYSTVDHRYIFAPALGGASAFDDPKDPLDRTAFGAGPYAGGSSEIDYFGVSMYGTGGTNHVYSMFACPFDVLTLTITPVAQLNAQLGSNLYLYFEARSYPAYFTSFGSPSMSDYAETTLLATILPFFRRLTELQITFTTIDSGDIFYLYTYGAGSGSDSFYLIGFWVELIGVPSV